ncbi:YncE family protein [Bacteroidota bacterium]
MIKNIFNNFSESIYKNFLKCLLLITLITFFVFADDLKVKRIPIGSVSTPSNSEIKLTLVNRFQHYKQSTISESDIFDRDINSPKSALVLNNKLYINNLEGYSTAIYNLDNYQKIKIIKHLFKNQHLKLFNDTALFDYGFKTINENYNIFNGKPVEGCFSHNGKYLWITYYRRSYDKNAIDPSAVAIINTENDEIVRIMPTGPLPKMIACSPDNKYIAVTHWGDNTIGIIDIASDNVKNFKYKKLLTVGYRIDLSKYADSGKVDRDHGCGYCLRGTIFTPDSKYLLVGRMGGGGIALFNMNSLQYIKSVFGMKSNLRHIIINNGFLYLGSNISGYVQKCSLNDFIDHAINNSENYTKFESCYLGKGVRTISCTNNGNYIFATVNNESRIDVINTGKMTKIASIDADSFPVGMTLNSSNNLLIVTSQGKSKYGGGNSVMIFKIDYVN